MSPTSIMHVGGESDGCVVPTKCPNNDGPPSAEGMVGRRPTKENIEQPTPLRTQRRASESSGLLGVREVARKERTQFTALLHHGTVQRLRERFDALKREAAPGGDGVTRLANVYLHYVFDRWVRRWRRHSATGDMMVVRYADDIVVGFEHRSEAERFLHEWTDRLRLFGLELHPDKTRLSEFGRHAAEQRTGRGEGKPGTFNVLGVTHVCGTTRKSGRFIVKRQTIRKRLSAKLKARKAELRHRWHVPVAPVGQWLRSVVRGWLHYYAIPGHMDSLNAFRRQVLRHWCRALRRRGQRRPMTWARFVLLVGRWIPSAKILHPHPNVRFDATHPRSEPYAAPLPVRFRAGGGG